VRVQVLSDIHLECRKEMYEVAVGSPVLALLGDIGYASDFEEGEKLREFIHTQSNTRVRVGIKSCSKLIMMA
jgi:hypothetical protein